MSPHNSQFIQANVRQHFQVHSSSSRLCVRQIESEQQSTVGEILQLLEVLALASRLAGPDNAVLSLTGSDSWLSKKKKKNSGALSSPSRLGNWWRSSYILDVVRTFWIWSSTNNWPVACGARHLAVSLGHLCDLLTYDHWYATSQRHDLWQWCNGKAIEALAGRRPTARWCCWRKLVFVRLPLLPY